MERVSVKSSSLKSIGYDETSKTLEIEFSSGGIYQYYEVPKNVYLGLILAESPGKFFHGRVNPTGYQFKKIS
ncbi:MAG: KTSC domain-containing protein [Candidatus Wallbacteria bacterium HGW-Wallbacteria-1]|jgi:hypothetical protein|uniref:KTSC domain-containing protein n=1 Tax=Candidatus Wallbacteria bacterium HGW-Wallbacteria-1 TaxID=2013854 RepID=A0A2N1PJ28_9BACT|nr:MAG: KTSC domain-containing protein [Candidatus Wallbacteria bacterium HGW-Wallbacteria-1]